VKRVQNLAKETSGGNNKSFNGSGEKLRMTMRERIKKIMINPTNTIPGVSTKKL